MDNNTVATVATATEQILECPLDPVLQEDMELLASNCADLLKKFQNKTVFVSGATGFHARYNLRVHQNESDS